MKKRNIFILIIGLITLITPFIFNEYNIFRLIGVLIGIILISLSFAMSIKHNKLIKIIIFPLVLILAVYFIDYELLTIFNRIPVISLAEKSSKNMIAYNSIGYRVYSCKNDLIIDNSYKKEYACSSDDIDVININKFLSNSLENYKKYYNKFIHLEGKINTIIGSSSLYLNYYEETNVTANGFVEFNEDKKVVVDNLNIDPKDYYIYDYVEVIGLVYDYVNGDDGIEIHIKDAKVIKSNIYDSYELSVISSSTNENKKISDNLYYKGIEEIYYKYNKDVIYELSYLLNDNRETLDNILKDTTYKIINEEDKLYSLKEYSIIECANNNTIIINNNISINNKICEFEN